jgi:hypothetical protein
LFATPFPLANSNFENCTRMRRNCAPSTLWMAAVDRGAVLRHQDLTIALAVEMERVCRDFLHCV